MLVASSSKSEDAGALVNSMLEDKQRELKATKRADIGSGILRTGTGALIGFAGGIMAVLTGALAHGTSVLKRVSSQHPDLMKWLDEESKRTGGRVTPQMEKTIAEFTKKFGHELEHESNTLGAGVIEHSNKWVIGLTAAGAGLGYLWYTQRHNQKVEAAEKEVAKLEHVRNSWQERVAAKEEKSADAGERTR
jgi:hypothetical protein